MKDLPLLQQKEDNPLKYLFCIGIIYLTFLMFPQHIGLDLIIAVLCTLLFIVRPLWGVFFIIAVHPVMSCSFEVFCTAGQPVEIISNANIPHGDNLISPIFMPWSVYPFQITAFLILPSFIFHCRPFSLQYTNSSYQKIIYTTLFFFFIWGMIIAQQATYPYRSFWGLSRFGCIIIIICYLVRFIDRVDIVRKVMVVYSCSALLISLSAYYSTYNGFENISSIFNDYGVTIFQRQALFNTVSSFNPEITGMLPGYGLAGKHEFSTFVVAGIFFSIYLFVTVKKQALSLFYIITVFTLYPSIFYAPCKLAIVGIIVGVLFATIVSPILRRQIAVIVLLLLALNIFGLAVSSYTRPEHQKLMSGATQNFKVVNDTSEFNDGIMGRIAIWKKTAQLIKQSNGIGIGPDMFNRNHNHAFNYPHGHNIFLTFIVEYGFPSIICIILSGILLGRQVFPIITTRLCTKNTTSLPLIPITMTFVAIFFEYNFDCFVWMPQLWIIASLMWISANIVYKNQTVLTNR